MERERQGSIAGRVEGCASLGNAGSGEGQRAAVELKEERQTNVVPDRSMDSKQCSEVCPQSKEGSEGAGEAARREYGLPANVTILELTKPENQDSPLGAWGLAVEFFKLPQDQATLDCCLGKRRRLAKETRIRVYYV